MPTADHPICSNAVPRRHEPRARSNATLLALPLFGALAALVVPVRSLPWSVVLLLVLAPIVEEIVFRAGLQEWLLSRLGDARAAGRTCANALTAIAFAAAHVAVRPTLVSGLTLLPAFAIGAVYQRTRRIAACIALHAVFNALWLLAAGFTA